MRKLIARIIGYPFQDFFRKTSILDTLKVLQKSQYWDDEKISDYQSLKLRSLIEHAYRNVPYYETLFKSIKLKPSDIKSIDDIGKIPILTKEIVRKENVRLIAKGFSLKYVKKGKTGGTTGVPIILYKDVKNRSFTWASYYRWYNWIGVNYYDKEATIWGARTVTQKSLKQMLVDITICYIQNKLLINAFDLSETKMWSVYKNMCSFQPIILKGYLSALLDFASFLDRNKLTGIKPVALSSTTETLLPHHRAFLTGIFNAPIYDQYGCGELSAISYECTAHNGLHINMEHILCEILDENNNSVIDTKGRVIGTDLDNFIMPFIRYENGDLSSIASKKCSCGVNQPLMNSIDGRTIDTIILKTGEKVHGVFFTDILYELGILTDQVQKFQVYQKEPGVIDFRLQCESPLEDKKRKMLLNAIQDFFFKVNYAEHKILQCEPNGKFKYIINDIVNHNFRA